jgi:hypothetical protein
MALKQCKESSVLLFSRRPLALGVTEGGEDWPRIRLVSISHINEVKSVGTKKKRR